MHNDHIRRKRTRRRNDAHTNLRALLVCAPQVRARAQEVAYARARRGGGIARDGDVLEVGNSPWDVPLLRPARAREPELGGEPRRRSRRERILDVEADDGRVEVRREVGRAREGRTAFREVGDGERVQVREEG